ncbi:hypothetical protein PDJAM_G00168680 [Pangasius djambal]|uniref:Uncharacterized protein n=1 Tax=Pangasius djambal TaxID=1691987 RepID=A0ACC5ZL55_9TELE|nr:hypothetical protein [Pangasius djambal]
MSTEAVEQRDPQHEHTEIEQNGIDFTRQIKTEDLNDSPHSASSHKTCHLTQGSPAPTGQLPGELPSLHPLPQLVLMSGSHLSSSSPFLLSQAQTGHQAEASSWQNEAPPVDRSRVVVFGRWASGTPAAQGCNSEKV